jgi:hypothetical protein
MFLYGTVGTFTGFDGEIVRLKPPQSWLGILWWCPPCSPEVVSEVKAHAKARFHMY